MLGDPLLLSTSLKYADSALISKQMGIWIDSVFC